MGGFIVMLCAVSARQDGHVYAGAADYAVLVMSTVRVGIRCMAVRDRMLTKGDI